MGKLNIDIVATPIINKDGICVDLEYADGTRFYDTDHGIGQLLSSVDLNQQFVLG